MSGSRAQILGRIRAANERTGASAAEAEAAVSHRLSRAPAPIIPARATGCAAELIARFMRGAMDAAATLARAARAEEVPGEVSRYLAAEGLGTRVVIAADPDLTALSWTGTAGIMARFGAFEAGDTVSVTGALAGIAETGTIMVASGATTPNALHFLAETHIVVLPAERIVGPYEAAYDRLRSSAAGLPRAVTMITGPSRSSDIERTVQIGVHGPRRLHIVIVGAE